MTEQKDRRDPIYWLSVGYMLALVIIGVMTFSIHIVLGKVIAEQNNASIDHGFSPSLEIPVRAGACHDGIYLRP